MSKRVAALCGVLLLGACPEREPQTDAGVPNGGGGDLSVLSDGGGPVASAFTIVGCDKLVFMAEKPVCTGPAPLELTFVPLTTGVDAYLWTFTGASTPSSQEITPVVIFARPGMFEVTLAAGGPAGTTTSKGSVVVTAGGVGDPCMDRSDCDATLGLTCVCGSGECPGGYTVGICTRMCQGGGCAAMQRCVDFSRGAPVVAADGGVADGGGEGEPWRRALCLPSCATSAECRIGLSCLEVPVLAAGAPEGGAFTWTRACVADVLGEVGRACLSPTGAPQPSLCYSGRCEPFGARGICTAGCSMTQACPSFAACATFNSRPGDAMCLSRCDAAHPCSDPLMACDAAGKSGGLGFTVPAGDPAGTMYCAPKRCTQPSDCAPSGVCTVMGAASFCVKS